MVKMFECIICDLDGTLLNSKLTISDKNLQVLKKFKSNGGKIILASGRPFRLIEKFIKQLELGKEDYVICRDGVFIYRATGELIYSERMLDTVDLTYIIKLLRKKRIDAFAKDKDYLYAPDFYAYLKLKIFSYNKDRIQVIKKSIEEIVYFEKIKIYSNQLSNNDLLSLKRKYSVCQIMGNSYELSTQGVNKYSALKVLINMKVFNSNNALFFGDDNNDQECFENLPHCVAMGNANERIKEMASFITKTNDEDGVAMFIKQLGDQEYV